MPIRIAAPYTLAEGILACICAALESAQVQDPSHPGCPCRVFVAPGNAVTAECGYSCGDGCDGQLAVTLDRIEGSKLFPASGGSRSAPDNPSCAQPPYVLGYYTVSLTRCVPVMDEQGTPPSPEELQTSARISMADQAAIYDAVMCCLPGLGFNGRPLKYTPGPVYSRAPQGGCVTIETTIVAVLPSCPCPEEGSLPLPAPLP